MKTYREFVLEAASYLDEDYIDEAGLITGIRNPFARKPKTPEQKRETLRTTYEYMKKFAKSPTADINTSRRVASESFSYLDTIEEGNRTRRMMQRIATTHTAHISADRGDNESKNREARKSLENKFKKHKIGFRKGRGEYKYTSNDGAEGTGTEVSYHADKPESMSNRRFGKLTRRFGRQHGQESVITTSPGKPARLHMTQAGSKSPSEAIGRSTPGPHPHGYGQTSGEPVRGNKLPKSKPQGFKNEKGKVNPTPKQPFHYG